MSTSEALLRQFHRIGAKLRLEQPLRPSDAYDVDIVAGRRQGDEIFRLRGDAEAEVEFLVVDVDPADRHLLLLVKQQRRDGGVDKHRYLCGHDERAWFVAAVPGTGITSVVQAKAALKPAEARQAQRRAKVRRKNLDRRHNRGFVRQGEWFFIPAPEAAIDERLVLRNEPLRRGSGKPHMVEFVHRDGGEVVYVCSRYPRGVSEARYRSLLRLHPALRGTGWQVLRRNPQVHCKGRVRHPDHATLRLRDWHRVLANTEVDAPGRSNLSFID
jgi:hypothetical protein